MNILDDCRKNPYLYEGCTLCFGRGHTGESLNYLQCPRCKGKGIIDVRCPECHGKGVDSRDKTCDWCHGSGRERNVLR